MGAWRWRKEKDDYSLTCQLCAWCACFDLIWMPHFDTTIHDNSNWWQHQMPWWAPFFLQRKSSKMCEIESVLFLKFIFFCFLVSVMFELPSKSECYFEKVLFRSDDCTHGAVLSVFFTIFCCLSKSIRAGRVLDIHAHIACPSCLSCICGNVWNLLVDGDRQCLNQSVLLWCHFDCQAHTPAGQGTLMVITSDSTTA